MYLFSVLLSTALKNVMVINTNVRLDYHINKLIMFCQCSISLVSTHQPRQVPDDRIGSLGLLCMNSWIILSLSVVCCNSNAESHSYTQLFRTTQDKCMWHLQSPVTIREVFMWLGCLWRRLPSLSDNVTLHPLVPQLQRKWIPWKTKSISVCLSSHRNVLSESHRAPVWWLIKMYKMTQMSYWSPRLCEPFWHWAKSRVFINVNQTEGTLITQANTGHMVSSNYRTKICPWTWMSVSISAKDFISVCTQTL